MVLLTTKKQEIALQLVLLLLTMASFCMLCWKALAPTPLCIAGITIDRLSSVFTLLVSFIGLVVLRFSMRYMEGETHKKHFLAILCLSTCAAYLFMLSTNLLLMFFSWTLTSMGLHDLLTFYKHRPEALPPARKKFLISRLGDAALIAAIVLIWQVCGSFDLHDFLMQVASHTSESSYNTIALLVTIAALTKSAQFPFHSWLPETMESPTPVSALMHAGIINAGGALLLRFAPLIAQSGTCLLLLSIVGTLTVMIGMVSMWAQVRLKTSLAWSTVAQMGFMMIQCGLAVFPAAALHIVGHGCYKAYSFLRSGTLPEAPDALVVVSPLRNLIFSLCGTILAIPALWFASFVSGFDPLHSSGEMALCSIVALSIGQIWGVLLREKNSLLRILLALGVNPVIACVALSLYHVCAWFFMPVWGSIAAPSGMMACIAAAIPVIACTMLVVLHAFLPILTTTHWGKTLHIYALNGFYIGAYADRLVATLWNCSAHKETAHA